MPNTDNRLLRVAAARADFLESGPQGAAGVGDVVVASWERSHAAGVDVSAAHSTFTDDIDTGSLLVRCARPVLNQLTSDTIDMPLVVALTDSHARVVQRIDASPAVGRLLERVDFAPGYTYAESTMGTNGVGTVLEAGQPVSVVGPEHFTEYLQPFACTGAPIIDPVTRRIEGVLDISTLSHSWSPIMHALVKSAAKDIAQNLLLDRSQAQQAIFATYLRESARTTKNAVFAFGGSIFMANDVAQAWFDAGQQQALREHAAFLMLHKDRIHDTVPLDDGRQVHITGTRIMTGLDVAGIVVTAEIAGGGRRGPGAEIADHHLPEIGLATKTTSSLIDDLARPRERTISGRSPAWQSVCRELRTALIERTPTIVVGETGTGKFTLVTELFHGLFDDARSISVDAEQFSAQNDPTVIEKLVSADTTPTLYILRNIDQCTTDAAEEAEKFLTTLRELEQPVWCIATLSDSALDSDLPFKQILGHFDKSVSVPPLRFRTDDVDDVTAALLRLLAPDRRVRISPEAHRVIIRYSWPRNVSQLREALVHALRRRPVGEIQAGDLPGYCQTFSQRMLTPVESAERDLIVSALRTNDGNRSAAAEQLGMARSSLYRKLRTYGIAG
ncbi:GAF domain-containing protein [Gordonia sp. PP30]|uniref:sigma-54-dependent Fis family transcriptional regulator n=1 Tax=unclassified Gordonia (in: high G+C Gram-positive bacteria) TaxID=2657482 RepID=UPI001FFF44E7|nr:helix-turn-helix domain-containing protein [Gordonia sp. PP30]UQE76220.1 GAF domain-containing protein [Gordonia sp. PP30]